ncbi:PAS domain S-box protein [Flavobacterium tegetincola]|uniref:PAS domain S-box protein n=1 Tax=Flavobacterium tegetincola TaxID=150172 RepID=UPI000413FB05|nr:PAS domain S-box protein [Flavobacterium tegetincola]
MPNTNTYFLQGGGEMGALIRAKDWSTTPLGVPENWPRTLRTMVSVMLNAPLGMYIAWGKEHTQIYNDGYRPLLGTTTHSEHLGTGAAPSLYDIGNSIESLFDGIMNGGPAGFQNLILPINRNGTLEASYFEIAYSPIPLENGAVGGVLITVIETTSKKEVADQLKASEERFKTLADNIPNLAWMTTKEGALYWYNQKWYDYTGTTPDKVMGWDWQQVIHPDYLPIVLKEWKAALSSGTSFELIYPLLGANGQYRSFLSRALPVKNEEGAVIGWFGSNTDMTLQKETEEALSDSKMELEFAIEAAQLGTFDFNPFTNAFSANNRLKKWFGLSENEGIDLSNALDIIVESDKSKVAHAITTALDFSSGGQYDIEYRIINPISKEEISLHAKGKAWFTSDKVAYRFNGTLEDVTAQTNARRLTALNAELTKNMVLEAPIGICVINASTLRTENVNDRFLEIVGKTYDEIYGNYYWDTFGQTKIIYEKELQKVIETELPFHLNEVEVLLHRHGTLEPLFITFVYAPLKNEEGTVVKVAVWVIDHTQQVLARNKITESEENLKLMILQAPISISILRGAAYRVEIANKNVLALWGRTEEEVLHKSIFESMPELQTQGIKELLDEVVATGTRFSTNELAIAFIKNGVSETVYVNFSYEPLYDAKDKITGIMVIGFDVSAQVYARQKAEESEESIRALVESAPFPIGVYKGKEMEITLANQSIMDAWGKGNEVVGKRYTDVLPELKEQKIFKQIQDVFRTGIPFHAINQRVDLEHNSILKSHYFNYSFTPLFDAAGAIYGVMNTAADITELHQAQQKIEESEKRFRNSVYQAPLGIAIFRGTDFITEIANNNYLALVDKTTETLIGIPLFEALPEVKDLVEPLFNAILKTGEPFHSNELPANLKRNGKVELTYFNLVYHPLFEENGTISGIMVVATEVTNTVKAKHLLQQSEAHFRNMVMQSPIPMTILRGTDYIIESANNVMLHDIWRKKREDVIGRPILELFPELKEQKYAALLHSVYNSGTTHSEKESLALIAAEDGTKEFYLDFEYAPLFETDGIISGIMITVNDVTDKVTARKKVENTEERLRLATEATGIATWDLDLVHQTIIHSPSLAELFGYDASAVLCHKIISAQVHPEDLPLVLNARKSAKEKGIYSYEARIIKTDGSIIWIRTQGKVYFNAENEPYKIIGTSRDINDERNFQHVLMESEAKFRLLADSIPQHIWTADPQGNIIYFNQFVFAYSGLTLEALLQDGWMQIVHPDDRVENETLWLASIATGKDFLYEHRFRRKDGTYRWQLSRAVPQRDESGTITRWVGTSTDVQDQKMFTYELEKQVTERTSEINQKNNALEKMNKELQSFAYISSHDLQEPLRKIQIFASQIKSKEAANLSVSGFEKFERIQNAAHRMQTLIQDLLVYSRSSFQERILEHTTLDAIISEVREDLSEEIILKQATLQVVHSCELHVITLQFRQVIFNLISNSLKFTREKVLPIIIVNAEVGNGSDFDHQILAPDQRYCRISIKDNGIGFSQDYKEKIFEVFQRLHAKEQFAGTGIGLAIVKKIIDNHKGFITASGVPDQGALFDIYIPA